MISKNAPIAASSGLDVVSQFQSKHKLSPTRLACILGLTENQVRRYFLKTKSKSHPSPCVIRLCILMDYIIEQGLDIPEFPDIE